MATLTVDSRDPWTGTVARNVTVLRSPDEDPNMFARIAQAAVTHYVRTRGPGRAKGTTLDKMIEIFVTDEL